MIFSKFLVMNINEQKINKVTIEDAKTAGAKNIFLKILE